jgi:hypothetical protein
MDIGSLYFQCTPLKTMTYLGSVNGLFACFDLDFLSSKNDNRAGKTSAVGIRVTPSALQRCSFHPHKPDKTITFSLTPLLSLSQQHLPL